MVLVLVVGPSGAGKDTLIEAAHAALADDPRFVFVRRVVTRHAVTALEDHATMDEAAFTVALMRGDFALHWEAHGLRYGIPATIDADLDAGRVVVANGSRAAIPAAREKYPDCVVLLVTADRTVRAARLAARGRESAEDVRARLEREGIELSPDVERIAIDNSGALADSVAASRGARGLRIEPNAFRALGSGLRQPEGFMSRTSLYGIIGVLAALVVAFGIYFLYLESQKPALEIKVDGNGSRFRAMVDLDARKQAILEALEEEIHRQAETDLDQIDLVALAVAVDRALGGDGAMPGDPIDDGRTPEELNAANDG